MGCSSSSRQRGCRERGGGHCTRSLQAPRMSRPGQGRDSQHGTALGVTLLRLQLSGSWGVVGLGIGELAIEGAMNLLVMRGAAPWACRRHRFF